MQFQDYINRVNFSETPAFIYDESRLVSILDKLNNVRSNSNCKILFSLKAFSIIDGLCSLEPRIDGFAVSSVHEAKLAKEVLSYNKTVHITTPGLKVDEISQITRYCDYISFNSLTQLQRFRTALADKLNFGLRINPQLSFAEDEKYDPCRTHSKLGVPLNMLKVALQADSNLADRIKGIHFHTNCESNDLSQLTATVKHIQNQIPELYDRIEWINLGGGYLFEGPAHYDELGNILYSLRRETGASDIFIEPGNGIIGSAGYIVSSVLDIFESDGKKIAILDTTVNHMPEVFEYQYRPDIMQESKDGQHEYILAGCSCLAGDVFGQYNFAEPLSIGDRIVFTDMGAYTLVKAHMFNGINLPTIYSYTDEGELRLIKEFNYEDFISRCGGAKNVLM